MKADKKITIKYYGDPIKVNNNHESDPEYIKEVSTEICGREFDDMFEAVRFLSECENPVTTIEEIIPTKKRFKYILREKNIRAYHNLFHNIEELFIEEDEEDTWG